MNTEIIQDVINHAIDKLEAIDSFDNACDLHHYCFNEDYFIIGTYKAKQWLGENAFDAIGAIQEYEESNFGEVSTDLSSPEKVANMLSYIIGELVLNESETLGDKWNEELTQDDVRNIISELEELEPHTIEV